MNTTLEIAKKIKGFGVSDVRLDRSFWNIDTVIKLASIEYSRIKYVGCKEVWYGNILITDYHFETIKVM